MVRLVLGVVLGFLLAVLLNGCASAPTATFAPTETILTRTEPKRPGWITTTHSQANGILSFSGGVERSADYSLAVRSAKAEALKNLSEAIHLRLESEFTRALEGDETDSRDLGRFVADTVAFASSAILQGVRQEKVYVEKAVLTVNPEPYYNTFVLLTLTEADYYRNRTLSLEHLVNRYKRERDEAAKKRAEQLLDKLRKNSTPDP